MSLFFETAGQAQVFLAAIPIGFLLALCIDLFSKTGYMRPVMDVLCLLLCSFALVVLMLVFRDKGLRVYHFLALIIGSLLYLSGVGTLVRCASRKFRAWKKRVNSQSKIHSGRGDGA